MQQEQDRIAKLEREKRHLENFNQRLRYDLALAHQELASLRVDQMGLRLVDGTTGQPLRIREDPPADPPVPPPSPRSRLIAEQVSRTHQMRKERDDAQAEARLLRVELAQTKARLAEVEAHLADLLRLGGDHA